MIPRRIRPNEAGSFRGLAEYIAAAKDPGEKLDQLWVVNAGAGEIPAGEASMGDISGDGISADDLEVAIREIAATQALNTRVRGDRNYHLVVSFRDEKPSAEAIRDMEREYARVLGFEDHQRVAATHRNTDNYHLHVAYNRIHPETLQAHAPAWDFRELEKVSRTLEQKHGLKVDPGRADKIEADRTPEGARDKEAHTWEQSFHGYVQEHREPLLKAMGKARNWQDLHGAFHEYDLYVRKRGNGLIISNGNRSHHIKASGLDRSCSKAALEKRFGPFRPPERKRDRPKPARQYKRRPVTRGRGQGRLWRGYLGVRRGRDSVTTKAISTWRDYLMYSAIEDPLAVAIIHAQKKMLKAVTRQGKSARNPGHSKAPGHE